MPKYLILLIGLIISVKGFSQQDSLKKDLSLKKIDSTKVKPKLEVLKRAGYSMDIPAGWKIMPNCQDNYCSIISPGDTLGKYDIFSENINFTVNKLDGGYTVDKYTSFSIKYLPTVVKNFKLIEKKKLKPNVYRVVYAGEKNNYEQTWRQYYYVKSQKVYIVTFACETPKYQYYLPLVEPALNSFKLL